MYGFKWLVCIVAYGITFFKSGVSASLDEKTIAIETGFVKRKHAVKGGPRIFIIGAQKCATTSLHHLLLTNPQVCSSIRKEIHYFDRVDSWSNGAAYYLAHFKTRDAKCDAGGKIKANESMGISSKLDFIDATPDYFTNPLVPARIYQSFSPKELSKKRFILILREPVSREFSWYNHRVRLCTKAMREYLKRRSKASPGPVDASKLCADKHCGPVNCKEHAHKATLGREIHGVANFSEYYRSGGLVASRSLYMTHLRRWLARIPREQFFILNLSTLLRNTTDTVQRLTRFLGIPAFLVGKAPGGEIVLPHENAARVDTKLDCDTRKELYAYYQQENRELMAFMAANSSSADRTRIDRVGSGVSEFEPPFPDFELEYC